MKTDLRRFVYAPKAYVFVYSRKTGGVYDVSNDVVSGSVDRLIDRPSSASVVLRNDRWKYTGARANGDGYWAEVGDDKQFNPLFLPMDGITIWLQKMADRPIQVFTGFIDSIPFYQAYPGTIEIKATCTLKQLLYTHFDPGFGFVQWLADKGWAPSDENYTGFYNPDAQRVVDGQAQGGDGGMGQLFEQFLIEIGGIDPNQIVVGDLPPALPETMLQAYLKRVKLSEAAAKATLPLLERFLTMNVQHQVEAGTSGATQDTPQGVTSTTNPGIIKKIIEPTQKPQKSVWPSAEQILLAAVVMSGINPQHKGESTNGLPTDGRGLFAEEAELVTAGSHGSHVVKDKLGTVSEQAERFCDRYNKTVAAESTGGGGPTTGTPTPKPAGGGLNSVNCRRVAETLAYGYGKERFYGQILEACLNPTNIATVQTVLDSARNNQNTDSISLTSISSGSVAETVNSLEVQWTSMFGENNAVGSVTTIPDDGKIDGKVVSLKEGKRYSANFVTFVPSQPAIPTDDIPAVDKNPIKYGEIKYYVYGVQDGVTVSPHTRVPNNRLGTGIAKGTIATLINANDPTKQCKCVYLGVAQIMKGNVGSVGTFTPVLPSDIDAPIAASDEALDAIGLGLSLGQSALTKISGIQIEFSESRIPAYDSKKDGAGQDGRKNYAKRIADSLGQVAKPTNNPNQDTNISDSDRSVYSHRYKGTANNRLAQYFYIASRYNLHLLNYNRPSNQDLLLTGGDEGAADSALSYLVDIGILSNKSTIQFPQREQVPQSIPQKVVFTLNGGKTVYTITFKRTGGAAPTPEMTASQGGSGAFSSGLQVVIQITADVKVDPKPVWNGQTVHLPDSASAGGGGGGGGTDTTNDIIVTWADLARMNVASAFNTIVAFPFDVIGSVAYRGDKSLMNDVPIMEGAQQLCRGSMRSLMSLPDGKFCAFYPDYFGTFGRTPYLEIYDIEIVDFNIVLNDESLVTHMYVNGQTLYPGANIDELARIMSVGVVTIDDIFQKDGLNFIKDPTLVLGDSESLSKIAASAPFAVKNKVDPVQFTQFYEGISDAATAFLEVFGTRPKVIEDPIIKAPWFEFVTAYNNFAYNWSMQMATNVELTFMPEVMAGGLIKFPEHDIVMYVEAVHHSWDYKSGFQTTAYLTAPSTTGSVPGMVIWEGLT